MDKNFKKYILQYLHDHPTNEQQSFANLYEIVQKNECSFDDIINAAKELKKEQHLNLHEINKRKKHILAEITPKGTREIHKIEIKEQHSFNKKIEMWLKIIITGTIGSFLLSIIIFSASNNTSTIFQAEITQEKATKTKHEAQVTLEQYLYLRGIQTEDIEVELLIESDLEHRYLVRCKNKKNCSWKTHLFWLKKTDTTWIIDQEENLRQ